MTWMSGAEALTKSILQYGVNTIFTLPGAQLDPMFDALYQEQDSIRVIHTRHEQGTAYMAFGYAQSTGKVGTNLVVPGPGFLNASAGLSTAFACGAKVLCLAGQIPSKLIGKGIGQLHELSDQPGAVASVTKWRGSAETPEIVPKKVQEAFKQLNAGRIQPVLLEMSPDIMATEGEVNLLEPIEDLSVETHKDYYGVVTDDLTRRLGVLEQVSNDDSDQIRMNFSIPTRGLIGFRSFFQKSSHQQKEDEPD